MTTTALEPTAAARRRRAWAMVRDLVSLTKPKVTSLLLAFGLVSAAVADPEVGAARLATFALLGYLAAGGAAALNHVFDRDLDARMDRTRARPVASGRVGVPEAVAFAALLLAGAIGGAAVALGVAVAAWMAAGAATYAGLYTLVLKRRTRHNIVIGGLAGSCGVLAGWSVADPGLAPGAWLLALLVFLWTPPHFWGLAIARDRDYRAAGVPMLPQVLGLAPTARAMLGYAVAMLLTSLLLAPVAGLGPVYLVGAAASGAAFVALCWATWRRPTVRRALWTFKLSGAYLATLLLAMVADLAA
ncbi:MAG: heme o synthase [Trueperaceae bacterium]|nr:heme o synthase [Trueperaceae bacterium]